MAVVKGTINANVQVYDPNTLTYGPMQQPSLEANGSTLNLALDTVEAKLQSLIDLAAKSTAGAQSSVSVTDSNTVILASSAARQGATLFNEGAAIAYVKLGSTATTTSYSVQMAANSYYEVPFRYSGAIHGITSSGTAQLRITELS